MVRLDGPVIAFAKHAAYAGFGWLAPEVSDVAIAERRTNLRGVDEDLEGSYLIWSSTAIRRRVELRSICRAAEAFIFFGASSIRTAQRIFRRLNPLLIPKISVVILSDTIFITQNEYFSKLLHDSRAKVYAMPDLISYVPPELNPIPFLQYVDVDGTSIFKSPEFLASHSPGSKYDTDAKGTSHIVRAFEKAEVDYKILYGMQWREVQAIKRRSHLFVDQCISESVDGRYSGGLGKSGIEAMKLRNVVLTSGSLPTTTPFFPKPPLVYVDPDSILQHVRDLSKSSEYYNQTLEEQSDWASRYLAKTFIVDHVRAALEG